MMDANEKRVKGLSILVIILALIIVGLLVYIIYDKKNNITPADNVTPNTPDVIDNTDKDDKVGDILNYVPDEIINFPKNDEGVIVKKVSKLTPEEVKRFQKKDNLPAEDDAIVYMYNDHTIKFVYDAVAGSGNIVINNSLVSGAVTTVNDPNDTTKHYNVTPVIHDNKAYVVSTSDKCYQYEDFGEVKALELWTVDLDDDDLEPKVIATFKSIPEGAVETFKCDK